MEFCKRTAKHRLDRIPISCQTSSVLVVLIRLMCRYPKDGCPVFLFFHQIRRVMRGVNRLLSTAMPTNAFKIC